MESAEIIKNIELPEELSKIKPKFSKESLFAVTTGVVVSSDEKMEHQFRNQAHLGGPSSVKASSWLSSQVWIKKSDGTEELIQKINTKFEVREGHKLALISLGNEKGAHIACYNFTTKEIVFCEKKKPFMSIIFNVIWMGIIGFIASFIASFLVILLLINFVNETILSYLTNLSVLVVTLYMMSTPIIVFKATNQIINFVENKVLPYVSKQEI